MNAKLADLQVVRNGWDDSCPDTDVIALVDKILETVLHDPIVSAAPAGGVKIQWSECGMNLEISFYPHGEIGAYCEKDQQSWASHDD